MSDYNDGPRNGLYPESPLGRQSNGYPAPSTRRTPRYSRASNPSWVSNGMLSPHPPGSSVGSRPLPVPSPPPSRGPMDFRPSYPAPSELEQEREPDPYPPYPGQPTSEARSDREWEEQGEEEAMSIGPSANEEGWTDGGAYYDGAPQPQEQVVPENDPYPYPVELDQAEPKHKGRAKQFVGGFVSGLRRLPKAVVKSHFYDRKATRKGAPGTEMSPGQSHFLPAYDDPGVTVANPESVHYVQSIDMPGPAPKSPTEISYANPTRRSSQQRTSLSQHRASQRSSSHAHGGQALVASVASSPRFRSPEPVDPLPASDYAKMDSPIRFAPPDDSFKTHITRVQNFFSELRNLPWTSERVALDYVPAASARAHVGKSKPHGSWYTGVNQKGHQEIDLLAPATVPARRGTIQSRSEASASVRSATRMQPDGRTPASYMTSPGALIPSPGASSHGQGHHMMSYSYYFAPPQPLYVYQSPMSTPMAHPGGTSSSSSSGMSRSPEAQAHQAVPVYMMAGPPPGLIPSPPPVMHASPHVGRAASPQVSIQVPGRPTSHAQSRHSGNSR
ncbi:hypothetical protein L226DRAFT_264739 [Lentinus tigrinus ALCF2SS1-7]|uniref:Uncharacterized protein n=1 Tax=Lentinus tigrinus ALCF2SS1-6 TaxID=1328759 RepID=A0A5C2S585_9APHY|nr:hypothetical protein L227DRAFT_504581 [Lentinus tigrinus ALCF2SS1-6]RPD69797.1 hypothetical protein L226DRAFT_264739 [Lentinus tigrinus ALCF2SS1-7]